MIYASLDKQFFEDIDAIVFVYDVNEPSSLKNIKQWNHYIDNKFILEPKQ